MGTWRKQAALASRRHAKNERRSVLTLLACLVVIATAMALMLPAISASRSDLETAGVAGMSNAVEAEAESQDEADPANEAAANEADSVVASEPEPEPTQPEANQPEAPSNNQEANDNPFGYGPYYGDEDRDEYGDGYGTEEGEYYDPEGGEEYAAPELTYPEQAFYDALTKKDADDNEYIDLAVYVEAPEGALPEGTTMTLERVASEDIQEAIDKAVKEKKGEEATASIMNAVKITFLDMDGVEIQPAKKVSVKLSATEVLQIEKPALARVTEVEVAGQDRLEQFAEIMKKAKLVNWDDEDETTGNENTLQFKAKVFGVFTVMEIIGGTEEDDPDAEGDNEFDADEEAASEEEPVEEEPAEAEVANYPAQQFSEELKDDADKLMLTVNVDAPEGALPEGATMKLTPITEEEVLDAAKEQAAAETEIDAKRAQAIAVDITFYDANGEVIEPQAEVHVTMSAPAVAKEDELAVVHMPEEQPAEVLEMTAVDTATATAEFDSAKFSVYALVYTVDFHYEVDGQTYDYSIQGGDTMSLKELVQILNVVSTEDAQEFVNNIQTVEFSNPELIFVTKVEEDATAGELKEKFELEPEYSDNLSETERANMDAKQLIAIDWALVTLKAFDTEEWLTITMANGEVFTIKVTDARDPLGLDDRTLALVVYDPNDGYVGYVSMQVDRVYDHDLRGREVNYQVVDRTEYCSEEAAAWYFEYDPDLDAYYISNGYHTDGSTRYMTMSANSDLIFLEESKEDAVPVKIEKNENDGTYQMYVQVGQTRRYLYYNTHSYDLSYYPGSFYGNADTNSGTPFHFCFPELGQGNDSHKATMISAQDLIPGQSVVIYQRVKQPDNTFLCYAIADDEDLTDGSAIPYRVWNSSDSVYWKGNPSLLWKFMEATDAEGEPNGYYYFVNEATGRYLAAKADGTIIQDLNDPQFNDLTKVVKREDHVQVALPAFRTGTYASQIANWDYGVNYTSGPRINDTDGNGVPENITSEGLMASQDFFFAVRDPIVQKQLTEVDTVNSKDMGITITMYDFSQNNINRDRLPYMTTVMGEANWSRGRYNPGLVSNRLDPNTGWPTTTLGNQTLGNIFTSNAGQNYRVDSWDANHLFIQSVYDSTGYFRYSSFENFARFNPNTGTFSVYEQIGVPATSDAYDQDWNDYYKKRGNFMPFDDLLLDNPRQNEIRPYDNQGLDPNDPRRGEDLYRMGTDRNYFFGMVMDAKFQQDKDGLNERNDPVRYEFNGDDDMWIYIDGVLVLDIGGVHDAFEGYIDFTSGAVVVKNATNMSGQTVQPTTIKACFERAGVFPDGTEWDDNLVDLYFDGNTFADYSSHDFKMIYMERGAGASNLQMQFNLTTLTQDQFKVTKEMPETETSHTVQDAYGNAAFYYRAYKVERIYNYETNRYEDVSTPIKKTDIFLDNQTYEQVATYEDGETRLVWHTDEIFELRPGHSAIFPVINHGVRYYVEEVEPDGPTPTDAGSSMLADFEVNNSDPLRGSPANKQVKTEVKTVQQRAEVIYTNKPDDGLVNELRIMKKLHGNMLSSASGGPLLSAVGSPYFEYAIYLENTDGKMVPYSLGPYYVIDKYGRFVYYTKTDDKRHYYGFEKNGDGTYSYYAVSPSVEGQEGSDEVPEFGELIETTTNPKITEYTGEEGYLGDVRDGDTLVIVGLLEGTHFIVDEIYYGPNDFLTLEEDQDYLDGRKYWYEKTDVDEYVHVSGENIPYDEHATSLLFNDPDASDVTVSDKAAEGDIRLDNDSEVTVHNRAVESSIPIIVEKTWTNIDADSADLADTRVKVTLGRYVLKDKTGTLTVKKTGVPEDVLFTAMYVVRNSDGNVVANIPYRAGVGSEDGVTINVPAGTYTVTEIIRMQDGGYNWNHDPANTAGSSVTISNLEVEDEGSATAAFACDPEMKLGSLRVTASYTIPQGATVSLSDVTYTVFAGDENSTTHATYPDGTEVAAISYAQASAPGGFLVEGLKAGTYTVKEEGLPANSTDGNYELSNHVPANLSHVTKDVEENQIAQAAFSGVYEQALVRATVIVTSTKNNVNIVNGQDFYVGDTVRLQYRINNSENITVTATGGTVGNAVQVQAPGSGNGWNGTYYRDIVITDPAISILINNPGLSSGYSACDPGTTSISVIRANRSSLAAAPMRAAQLMANSAVLLAADGVGDGAGAGDGLDAEASEPDEFAVLDIDYGRPPVSTDETRKYVDDQDFLMQDPDDPENPDALVPYTIILTQDDYDSEAGAWVWSTDGLPEADADGYRYYYYIKEVAEVGAPDGTVTSVKLDGQDTFLVGKDEHMTVNNSTTPPTLTPDPLEVNNEVTGALKVTKVVTVDGEAATAATAPLVDDTYNFTITGPSGTKTVEVTISNGQENFGVVDGLIPGEYTVTEITPTNGTALVGNNNVTVSVAPGAVGENAATVTMTNNINTTELTVNKTWSDGAENHAADSINYTVYRIPYIVQGDSTVEYDSEVVATGTLSAANTPTAWQDVITNLPETGEHVMGDSSKIAVSFRYYISEEPFSGYDSTISGGESQGVYSFTIVNEPRSSFDQPTDLDIEKDWTKTNSAGAAVADTDPHAHDSVTFHVTQKKYVAQTRYTYRGTTYTRAVYPIRIRLVNGDGTESELSRTVYVPAGTNLEIQVESGLFVLLIRGVVGTGFDTPANGDAQRPGTTFAVNNVSAPRQVTLTLNNNTYRWDEDPSILVATQWSATVSNSHNVLIAEDQLEQRLYLDEDSATETAFDYTMRLNSTLDDTEIIPGQNSPQTAAGNGVWAGTVSDLPALHYDESQSAFYVYKYEVSEIKINESVVGETTVAGFDGETSSYYVTWSQDAQSGTWTITNQKKPAIDITIHKVDQENFDAGEPLLPGAKFKLIKYTQLTPVRVKDLDFGPNQDGESAEVSESAQNPGIFSFEGLEAGYYEIVESQTPNGYNRQTENPVFLVRSNSETHEMEAVLVYTSGNNIGQPISGNATETVKIGNTTITVGNTPGVPLPHTGGFGTLFFTIFGMMLVAIAGGVFLLGRRRPANHVSPSVRRYGRIGGRR